VKVPVYKTSKRFGDSAGVLRLDVVIVVSCVNPPDAVFWDYFSDGFQEIAGVFIFIGKRMIKFICVDAGSASFKNIPKVPEMGQVRYVGQLVQ
tara:strand:- start:6199 stop:6477 length:279 start_codon:yes stop_codon:yes gene_type:complete